MLLLGFGAIAGGSLYPLYPLLQFRPRFFGSFATPELLGKTLPAVAREVQILHRTVGRMLEIVLQEDHLLSAPTFRAPSNLPPTVAFSNPQSAG